MTTFFTHCIYHMGDHLAHLYYYLRKQAVRYPEHHFVHAAHFEYLPQLIEVVSDISNISLIDIEYKPESSGDVWKNSDLFYDNYENKSDYAAVYVDFFRYLSSKLGLSLSCKYIVGICNGSTWPTFNIWNTESVLLRILLLDREQVLIAPNTEHARTMPELVNILRSRDLL